MAHKTCKFFVILAASILLSAGVQGQKKEFTEQDLIKRAENLFTEQEWTEALPLYAQLVSVYPDNAQYNFKFGVCALMGDRSDSERPVRYLNIAYRSMPDNKEVLYYLGLAYFQDQEFASALKFFNSCLERTEAGDKLKEELNAYIASCHRGLELIHKNQLDEILSKSEFQYSNFHRAYPADEFEGSLIQKPENFISPQELKSGAHSFVYVSEPRGVLYYSGYVDEKTGQRDIFRVTLNKKGEWGKPELLSNLVNTPFDEDYPVVTDDGTTLYFSSKGHNSMGGYDVFKSTYDIEAGEFGSPENMGIGINSPFDDILYIPDRSGRGAYFASNRENREDNITVFRVSLNDGWNEPGHMLAENSEGKLAEENEGDPVQMTTTEIETRTPEDETALAAAESISPQSNPDDQASPSYASAGQLKESSTTHEIKDTNPVETTRQAIITEPAFALNQSENKPATKGQIQSAEPITSQHVAASEKPESVKSNAMKVNWELVYDDAKEEGTRTVAVAATGPAESPVERGGTNAGPVLVPSKQVEAVAYGELASSFMDEDEDLAITADPDPVKQVQVIRYAASQPHYLSDDEMLEITLEPKIAGVVQPIAYTGTEQNNPEEDLEIISDPDPVKPVQLVHYAASQASMPGPDEELEIHMEMDEEQLVLAIENALRGGSYIGAKEALEIMNGEPAVQGIDTGQAIALTSDRKQHDLSTLTAFGSGLLVFPEPVSVPFSEENAANYAELINMALNNPDQLTYEELLFAASMATDSGDKLKIYYASFIRSDRDWRAYYNASVAARDVSSTDKAEVYLYQASLIYDEELVGQVNKAFTKIKGQ